eukprot:sb/3471005/
MITPMITQFFDFLGSEMVKTLESGFNTIHMSSDAILSDKTDENIIISNKAVATEPLISSSPGRKEKRGTMRKMSPNKKSKGAAATEQLEQADLGILEECSAILGLDEMIYPRNVTDLFSPHFIPISHDSTPTTEILLFTPVPPLQNDFFSPPSPLHKDLFSPPFPSQIQCRPNKCLSLPSSLLGCDPSPPFLG